MINKILYYRYMIFVGTLFSLNALGTSILGVFMNSEWSQMSPTTKFCSIVLITVNWTGTLLAFINKVFAQVTGQKPIDVQTTVTEQKG